MSVIVCRLEHGLIAETADGKMLRFRNGINEVAGDELAEFQDWLAHNALLPIVRRKDVFVVPNSVSDRLARDISKMQRRVVT